MDGWGGGGLRHSRAGAVEAGAHAGCRAALPWPPSLMPPRPRAPLPSRLLQPLMRIPASTPFTSIPCGVCPGAVHSCGWPPPNDRDAAGCGWRATLPPICQLQQHLPSTAFPAVFTECVEGGKVSPQTCVYYQRWLDQLDF